MKFPKFVSVAVMAGAVALVSACGSDSDEPPLVTTPPAASATSDAAGGTDVTDPNVRPSVATLNEMLNTALDPDVSNDEKVLLVEGSEKDPAIFDQLVKARTENPDVTYEIFPPVIPAGPNKATVKVQIKLPDNPPTKIDASIVFDDGRWKLASSTVCPLVSGAELNSPMCQTGAASSTEKSGN